MATPPRLVELKCPKCSFPHWEIDHDFRAAHLAGGVEKDYEHRTYKCNDCGHSGIGYAVVRKSPPEFMLQPHGMYPMKQRDFDFWAQVLVTNFPDDPRVARLGKDFRPNTRIFLTKLHNKNLVWTYRLSENLKYYKYTCGYLLKQMFLRWTSRNEKGAE